MPTIPCPCVGFYSIPSSPPVPPTIPRPPVTPNGVIALEQPMHKGSTYAAEWGKSTKKVNFLFFHQSHSGFTPSLVSDWLKCNPCRSWPSSWKISTDIGNMAVNKGLTVTPLAICDTTVLIGSPLISFSFCVSCHHSGFCNEPCSGNLKTPLIIDQGYI